jgi:hypothetical protein
MVKFGIKNLVLRSTGASGIDGVELIQRLWSGYGELSRVKLDAGSIILKLIDFPGAVSHPRGWNSDFGHMRKINSYKVENYWYQFYNEQIPGAKFPVFIAGGEIGDQQYLIIEDLLETGFAPRPSVTEIEVKQCLEWLAHFHRTFVNRKPVGLWPVGTYWHLDTRPEELEAMSDKKLKDAAARIDATLNGARYQTIVHGDAKLANFLFNGDQAAAVDFQYVGGGVGIKDVAYFLSSVYYEEELEENEASCLDHYFSVLNLPKVEAEWRQLYPVAWTDFYRFLIGWSPGHKKVHAYSRRMRDEVLKSL